jgi:hypothetical protein
VPTYVTQTELTLLKNVGGGTFFGHTINLALLSLFPRDPPRPRKQLSCAVVGSAGHLRGSNLGAHIDAHDVVLRFNDAPSGTTCMHFMICYTCIHFMASSFDPQSTICRYINSIICSVHNCIPTHLEDPPCFLNYVCYYQVPHAQNWQHM